MIPKLIAKAKAFWASLPHQVQAAVVTFSAAAGGVITHAIEEGRVPNTWADIKHLVGTAIVSGLVALRVFYFLPNGAAQIVANANAAAAANGPTSNQGQAQAQKQQP